MGHFPHNYAHYKKAFSHILYFNFQSFPLNRTTVLGILSQEVHNPTTTMYYFYTFFKNVLRQIFLKVPSILIVNKLVVNNLVFFF